MTNYKLSELEATLILSYTARTSNWTNGHSHDSLAYDTDKLRCEHNSLFAKILDKLPGYNQKTVFRMDFNSPANHDQDSFYSWISKRIGQIIHVPYFWSTSKERWDDDCSIWKIQTCTTSKARDISDLTQNPNEQEILFISGTNFQIKAVDTKNKLISVNEITAEQYDIPLIGIHYKNY